MTSPKKSNRADLLSTENITVADAVLAASPGWHGENNAGGNILARIQQGDLLVSQLLLQQQRQDRALLAAAGGTGLLFGTNALGSISGFDNHDFLQAALLLQNQQRLMNLVRGQSSLRLANATFLDAQEGTDSGSTTGKFGGQTSSTLANESAQPSQLVGNDDEFEEDENKDKKMPSARANDSKDDGQAFPQKLHRLILEAEKEGNADVLSFVSHGRAFQIHKPKRFEAELMPKYFTTTRLSSFQRQLNLYSFSRITEGPDKGGYCHELFLKDKPGLCKKIKRKKSYSSSKRKQFEEFENQMQAVPMLPFPRAGVSAGLENAAKLLQLQMLRQATGAGGLPGSSSALFSSGVDQAAISLLLEQKKADLILNQIILQQQQQQQENRE